MIMENKLEYFLEQNRNEERIVREYIDNISKLSNEELTEVYNKEMRIGIVGVRRQALYLNALRIVLDRRMGDGPIYMKQNAFLGMKGKIKYEDGKFSNYPKKATNESDLIKAYKGTDFRVFEPTCTIRIDEENVILNELLLKHNCKEWAFITAWNPFSELETNEINEAKNIALKEDLKKYIIFEGEGLGQDPTWKPEHSFLALGIEKEMAIELGRKYRQKGIVYGVINRLPVLLLL